MRDTLEKRKLSRSTLVNVIPAAVANLFKYEAESPARGPRSNALKQTKRTIGHDHDLGHIGITGFEAQVSGSHQAIHVCVQLPKHVVVLPRCHLPHGHFLHPSHHLSCTCVTVVLVMDDP